MNANIATDVLLFDHEPVDLERDCMNFVKE